LRAFWGALAALVLVGAVSYAPAQGKPYETGPARTDRADKTYRGGLISPPQPKPEFTLTDTSGAAFDFKAKTQGYVTLLFFGYTHCPDLCPLQMYMIAQAMKDMPAAEQNEFRVVFVTTDPDRDTPAVLRAFLNRFDRRFIGLTGSQQAIDAAQIAAKLPPAKKSAVRADGAYEVGHAAFVFAYTKDNLAHLVYPGGLTPKDWSHDLPYLAGETWATP
jgi:protein SCO1/2